MRFLCLGLEDAVSDAKTLRLYREALTKADAVEELSDLFDALFEAKGLPRDGRSDRRYDDRFGAQTA